VGKHVYTSGIEKYSTHRRPDGRLWRDTGKQPETPQSDTAEDETVVSLASLTEFLRTQRAATKGTPRETPQLNQILFDKPAIRQLVGPVIAAYVISKANRIDGIEPPIEHEEAIAQGHAIFAATNTTDPDRQVRIGSERIVDEAKRAQISEEAAALNVTPLVVGRTVLELLEGTTAHGSAEDALLALNLDALNQAAVAEAPPAAA
jgi:hypothetical protein